MKQLLPASIRHFLLGGILFSFLSGCSVLDPAEEIPSYLHIDALTLTATGGQGSSTSKITDAWIYMDGQLIGAFQLPCTVPILAEGTHAFLIKGGVKMNGLSSTRAVYPYWKGWEGSVTLTRAQVTSIGTQTVVYFPGTTFVWQADFEAPATDIQSDPSSLAHIIRDTTDAFEDTYSGSVHLNADTTLFLGATSVGYLLPPQTDIYLEFNYKCNTAFSVGIEGPGSDFHPWLVIDPSTTWNKIYIRLTDILSVNTLNVNYKIYFGMTRDASLSQSYLYLDNIKLLK